MQIVIYVGMALSLLPAFTLQFFDDSKFLGAESDAILSAVPSTGAAMFLLLRIASRCSHTSSRTLAKSFYAGAASASHSLGMVPSAKCICIHETTNLSTLPHPSGKGFSLTCRLP